MIHPENSKEYQGLTVNSGVEQPSIVNPYLRQIRKKKQKFLSSNRILKLKNKLIKFQISKKNMK